MDALEQLQKVEAGIVRILESVPGMASVIDHDPMGVLDELPCAYIRWLAPVGIVDAETGGGQDVTHAWRLELSVEVDVDAPELSQGELKQIVQSTSLAFRESPKLVSAGEEPIVDRVRLGTLEEADYFRRPALNGDPIGPILYGLVLRLEADYTETTEAPHPDGAGWVT